MRNFQQFIAAMLLVVLMAPTALKAAMIVQYFAELETYKELCSNKDTPEIACNGSCIFAAELKTLEPQADPEAPIMPDAIKIELLPYVSWPILTPAFIMESAPEMLTSLSKTLLSQFLQEIPVPPPTRLA
jgi:hypothetical protein